MEKKYRYINKSIKKSAQIKCRIIRFAILAFFFNIIHAVTQNSAKFIYIGNGTYNNQILATVPGNRKQACFTLCLGISDCNGIHIRQKIDGFLECGYSAHYITSSASLSPDTNIQFYSRQANPLTFNDCNDVANKGYPSGIYNLKLTNLRTTTLYCHKGFATVMRNENLGISFYRTWNEYAKGFGDLLGSYYLGNENIHYLTRDNSYRIKICFYEDVDKTINRYCSSYFNTSVDSAENNYKLHLGKLEGTTHDIMVTHNEMPFSTYDKDNDNSSENCAEKHKGGFWFNDCMQMNPTGILRENLDPAVDGVVALPAKNYVPFRYGTRIFFKRD